MFSNHKIAQLRMPVIMPIYINQVREMSGNTVPDEA